MTQLNASGLVAALGKARSSKTVRCAIYTRVSTDQGLEQDFNSLDAQYDASQAYIRSQAHAGWMLLGTKYDDGGYSGGNFDRLTRALADFAKLVELFDQHNVSFVSVTQQFNTTTSVGRLTLNVLLSFAQFEREVTSAYPGQDRSFQHQSGRRKPTASWHWTTRLVDLPAEWSRQHEMLGLPIN